MRKFNLVNRRAQVTLFIIIAIIIIAGISAYFYYRSSIGVTKTPSNAAEDFFLSCSKNVVSDGIQILEQQGGYIELPKFEPGSSYMPFSSQLDFLGAPVQYWYYISGNNIVRQKVPSTADMEKQLADYVANEVKKCDLSSFELQGYDITYSSSSKATVKITDNKVTIDINYPLTYKYGQTSTRFAKHSIEVDSKLGKFYKTALSIYNSEQKNLFLENYSIDVLTLYAPTSGVELSCAPKIWLKSEIKSDVKTALEGNIAAIKIKGNYYKLAAPENKYFVQDDISTTEKVNFLYSGNWPTRFEVSPGDEVIVAKPVGMQEGMGILGFCYVQYHFVYDLAFPVLVQVYNEKEMFQFPVVVIIKNNKARNSSIEEPEGTESIVCSNKNTNIAVNVQDLNGNPVNAQVKFKCFNEECDIGSTTNGLVYDLFPQCINGFIVATADGYADAKLQLDTNEETSATLFMKPLHALNLDLSLTRMLSSNEYAIASFVSPEYTATVSYPQQRTISIPFGFYNVSVQVYKEGNIQIGAYTTKQCVKVPASGILGVFGIETEKCFDINMPSQTLNMTLAGGGNAVIDISESELKSSSTISITVPSFNIPSNLLDLQKLYEQVDMNELSITLS
ncbi:hypothetical protein HZA33_03930 [Candidatus Pacearchaeota archaeon]|nr:hypothetical protein [Candidatus Pacearchaeota archaeon]